MEVVNVPRVETNKKYACPFYGCTSVFDRPYRLAQHRLVHVNVKPFVCVEPNCEKAYTSKSHLDRHIKSVHKETELNILYCCPKCMKKYVNRQNLKRHIKVSHIDNNKPFCCALCRIYFKKKHQLRAHMFIHNGVKPFRCPMCDRDFITLYEKKKHMRNHKVYECEHCERKFTRWTELMQHKRVDHVSPEYICHDCGKVFKERGHIIRHVKKHMPNTPVTIFFCPYDNCFRHYSRNSNLKQHILVKHEGLTYDCSVCGAKLSTKAKLNEHVERHSRPEPVKVHKTLETGRKKRKDAGTIRYETAMRLAGIVKQKIEEGISRLYSDTMHYQNNFEINTTNPCNENVDFHDVNDPSNVLEVITDIQRNENCASKESNQAIEIKVELNNSNSTSESVDVRDKIEDVTSLLSETSQSRDEGDLSSRRNESVNSQAKVKPNVSKLTNIIEILNRPSKSINFHGQTEASTSSQLKETIDVQVKIEATNEAYDNDFEDNFERGTTSVINNSTDAPGQIGADASNQPMPEVHIKEEHNSDQQSCQNEATHSQGNIAESMLSSFNVPSPSTNALSSLLQLYWRTILNYKDV